MEQRTDEWYEARLGIPTASSFNKLISSTGKPSTQAQGYINQLIAEAVTGKRPESFTSEAIERGIELESQALAWYEFAQDVTVEETGFHRHKSIACGCSPDGLVGDTGLIEIKCPLPHNHVAYLRAEKVPAQYMPQVQGQLWVMEREWCDFLSFHPDLPAMLIRVERDEKFIELLAAEVTKASETIEKEVAKLKEQMQ